MAKPSPANGSSDVTKIVASVSAEIAQVRESLVRIERQLAKLETPSQQQTVRRDRPERYLRVLVEVYDHGGHLGVDADALAAIGARHGYDRRGLGGFFTGARAPLSRDGEWTRLTNYGEELMDAYLAESAP